LGVLEQTLLNRVKTHRAAGAVVRRIEARLAPADRRNRS
jgi:hypothetical protein